MSNGPMIRVVCVAAGYGLKIDTGYYVDQDKFNDDQTNTVDFYNEGGVHIGRQLKQYFAFVAEKTYEQELPSIYVVGVRYTSGMNTKTVYEFLATEKLEVGDTIVVDSVYGLGVAKVVYGKAMETDDDAKKLVVCKIDVAAHEATKERVERMLKIKLLMEHRRRKLENTKVYETLAETDDEMRDLLSEFKNLSGRSKNVF